MKLERPKSGGAEVAGHRLIQDLAAAWNALPKSKRCEDNLNEFLSAFEERRRITVPESVEIAFYTAVNILAATRETHRSITRLMLGGFIREGVLGSPEPPYMTGEEMIDEGNIRFPK